MKTQNKSIGKTLIKLFVCIVLFAALLVGVLYLVDKDIFSNDNTVNAVKDNTETTQQNQDQNNNNTATIEGGLIVDEDVNKTVSSKVVYNNIALSGVNVYVDNKLAVTTDVNGNFTLNTQLGKVIRFDKYGYNINAITVTQDFPSTVVANAKNYVLTIKSNTLNYGVSIYAKSSNQSLTYFGDSNSFKVNLHIINGEDYNVTITKENFVKTYNVIFSKGAMMSLWGHLLSAISGGSVYRKTTFLHDSLNKEVLPEFISLHEDPFIVGGLASGNFDGEGVQARVSDIVDKGVLKEFLLSSYTARKLNLKTNGHSGSVYNLCVVSEKDPVSLDEMMKEAGSGIVITDLMGQGVDLLTGNYSRGAAGFYFENGERKHAVEEITVAGNLKDMFKNIALVGNDYDDRFKIKSGSLLIPDMTISGI